MVVFSPVIDRGGKMARDRISELDTLRGLAFAAVVLQHTIGIFNQRGGLGLADRWAVGALFAATKFAVPAFVFITGLVLFYNYSDRLDYPGFLRKRIREIVVPYLLWSLIYTFRNLPLFTAGQPFFLLYMRNVLFGTASYHLWFIVLIMQFYILFPLWRYLFIYVRKVLNPGIGRWVVFILACLVYLVMIRWSYATNLRPANAVAVRLLEYRDRSFILWYMYFILGGAAAFSIYGLREMAGKLFGPALATFLIMDYYFTSQLAGGQAELNLPVSASFRPMMAIFSIAAIMVSYYLAMAAAQRLARFNLLDTLGRYSLGAYFAHAMALNFAVPLARTVVPSGVFPRVVVAFLLAVIFSLAFTMLISRLPLGSLLAGRVYRDRKEPGQVFGK